MPEYVNLVFFCATILFVLALIVSHVIGRRKAVAATRLAASDPVRFVANRVRRAFEKIAKEDRHAADLGGLCGRAAVQICLEARSQGVDGVKLVHGLGGHAFSRLPDGRIVDVTATQFKGSGAPVDGYAAVEIGREHDQLPSWYKEDGAWENVEDWLASTEDPKPVSNSNHRHLYGARRYWERDRKIVEEIK